MIEAFIDRGYSEPSDFCFQFLYSHEFNINTLKSIAPSGKKSQTKPQLAKMISQLIIDKSVSSEDVLLAFCKQSRKWLTFESGKYQSLPQKEAACDLLFEFGKNESWYEISIKEKDRAFFIKIKKIPHYENVVQAQRELDGDGNVSNIYNPRSEYAIRWTVIAEIRDNCLALSWNNFRYNSDEEADNDEAVEQFKQYPYWRYIPIYMTEIKQEIGGDWTSPNMWQLILHQTWDKYMIHQSYSWKHLRIRADSQGVALNAHSTGAMDCDERKMKGLEALSGHLAETAIQTLEMPSNDDLLGKISQALLKTLMKDWGTKSYEFSLDKTSYDEDNNEKNRAYFSCPLLLRYCTKFCYPQDSFMHLHCFIQQYGGSSQTLNFLLSELLDEDEDNET